MTSNLPIVIFFSGKRSSGKTTISNIFKDRFEKIGLNVQIKSLSYYCKLEYCKIFDANIELMMNSYEYKEHHRTELTKFFNSTNPMIYSELLESEIDKNVSDIYIVDDMRLLNENARYFKSKCSNKWKLIYIRINATDEVRISRGWKKSEYDDEKCENDLDNYLEFDYIIQSENLKNLENRQKYNEMINEIINEIINRYID